MAKARSSTAKLWQSQALAEISEVWSLGKLYVLGDGEITSYVEGEVSHEWGDSFVFRPAEGYFLLEGDRLFDPEQYMIYTVEAGGTATGSGSVKCEDGIQNDIEKQIFDFEHKGDPQLTDEPEDVVNHPSHYETGRFECIDVMCETQGIDAVVDFCICNGFKYLYRHKNKNGVEDLKKARWYLDKAIELIEGADND